MKMKIKFIEDCSIEAQGEIEQSFKAGEVAELSMSSARRWLRRNLATEVMAEAPKKSAPKPAVKKRAAPITSSGGEKQAPVTSPKTAPK